ncbi:uncharacterized protein RSE6_03660 [Rhynchosporium secalis]|uniref:Uncharacterized protein n=1 Tax=Rhynchosporium secalis TaxID=38038 RepID=A0A1E1M3C6_RHYSE|nr:uncharacterized protein RSE6_03660 [Rhynchosporium secalis]
MHRVRDAVRALSYIVCMHVFVNRSLAYLLGRRKGRGICMARNGHRTVKRRVLYMGSRPGTLINTWGRNYLVALSTSVSTSALSPFNIQKYARSR